MQSLSFAQVHIREKIEIIPQAVVPNKAAGSVPPSVPSGFVIPRSSGLRTSLQVQFGLVQKLDQPMPPYASFETYFGDSTKSSSLHSYLPVSTANWLTFYNSCISQTEGHWQYQYQPDPTPQWDTVGRVFRGDTITFAYITNRIDQPSVRDTIPILITDTVKVREASGDSVIVGWNVTLGSYNSCIEQYDDHLDAFVGLNCATYSRLNQGDTRWRDTIYLWANSRTALADSTIRSLGCALTCLAMVGQAYGLQVSPSTLNRHLKDNFVFAPDDSVKVKWEALNDWEENNMIKEYRRIGKGLVGSTGTPLSLDTLDFYLNQCQPVIAQVLNPTSNRNHWVVVQQKNSQGRYPIVDPGNSDRGFLNDPNPARDYRNRVFRLIVFKLK